MITLPQVTDDFDGQLLAVDEAIRNAAIANNFQYTAIAPHFDEIQRIPDVVYRIVEHYTRRGFLCEYRGEEGRLTIKWSYPNMSYLEQKEITRAYPGMIQYLGMSFRASLLYLCMTNGTDLRKQSNVTMQRELAESIKKAATLGNLQLTFGYAGVPSPVVANLFNETFELLTDKGFQIVYNTTSGLFNLKWTQTFKFDMRSGSLATLVLT